MPIHSPLRRSLPDSLRGAWRLFTFRRAVPADFAPVPELFALLVLLDLAFLFAFAVAVVGFEGELNHYELPRTLMFVPLVLALGMVTTRVDPQSPLLRLPVALAAVGLLFTVVTSGMYFLAQRQWLPFAETYWEYFDYFALGWSGVVVVITALSLTSGAFSPIPPAKTSDSVLAKLLRGATVGSQAERIPFSLIGVQFETK